MVVLHDLEVGGGARCVCQGRWGRFFWLVHLRHGNRRDLQTGVEGRNADTLVLWFVVARGDAGAVGVEGVCIGSAGVEGAGIVCADVAVAVAVVVECVGPFADGGVDAEVGIVDGGGARVDVNGDADGVVGAAVAVAVGFVSVAVAVAAAVVVATWGRRGTSGVGGDVARVEGML